MVLVFGGVVAVRTTELRIHSALPFQVFVQRGPVFVRVRTPGTLVGSI
jgi:hypothetical protein